MDLQTNCIASSSCALSHTCQLPFTKLQEAWRQWRPDNGCKKFVVAHC